MDYDVVIATRNRPEALKLSIPLILTQERPPKKLIIVDASDDHQLICKTVKEALGACPVELVILNSQPNSARQRNIGLKYVESPIVMFPDDDSLWWPGVAEAIMRIYERDKNGVIGGVCAAMATQRNPEMHRVEEAGYKMRLSDRVRRQIGQAYNRFTRFCYLDPLWLHGRSRLGVQPAPEWLSEENAVLVEHMGGYRMSFRTHVFEERGFDEDLGAYVGYAKCEDTEFCFYVMRKKLLVGARNAKVFHYKFPSRRGAGFKLGFISQLNPAYIVCKHSPKGSIARRAIRPYSVYRLMQYMLGIHTQFGRELVRGMLLATCQIKELLQSPPNCLRECYLKLCKQALSENMQRNEYKELQQQKK